MLPAPGLGGAQCPEHHALLSGPHQNDSGRRRLSQKLLHPDADVVHDLGLGASRAIGRSLIASEDAFDISQIPTLVGHEIT